MENAAFAEKQGIEIRDAAISDAPEILKIYDYYVSNTAVSFEYVTPTPAEFEDRMRNTLKRYPYLVILKEDRIAGYSYAGPFKARAAYDHSCEVTIYLEKNCRKCGMGRLLSEALEGRLREMGILNLYACIAYPRGEDPYLTTNSADFHAHMGYAKAGEFHQCGRKFDRWYDMVWMEKMIGEHGD